MAGQLHGLGERREQPGRNPLHVVDLAALVEDHHELVAAEARHHVACPQRTAQPVRHFEQEQIAGLVAQRIVDDLEPVEIDEQNRKTVIVALRGVDRLAQQPVEGLAVRQVGQAVMRGEVFDSLVRLVLLVGAIEILHRKGDVVGETLQQLDELGREGARFGRHVDHDADGLVVRDERKRRARPCAVVADDGMEDTDAIVVEIVVADAGLACAECRAAHSAPLGTLGVDGEADVARGFGGRPGRGHDLELVAVGPGQRDCRRGELGAVRRREADEVEQLGARLRPHDRLVGGAQRREHARQALLLRLGAGLFLGPIEIVERERDVLGKPPQELDQVRRERAFVD
ncbi:hypothetical protein ACVI1J_002727 [Bradyrhizobium diazoefficiens]